MCGTEGEKPGPCPGDECKKKGAKIGKVCEKSGTWPHGGTKPEAPKKRGP